MNRTTTILAICLTAVAATAQKADIEVEYNYRHHHFSGKEVNTEMVLLANASESKFYNRQTELVDSLESTPEGDAVLKQMNMAAFSSGFKQKAPSRKAPMYIFKAAGKDTRVYDGNVMMLFKYTEPRETQNWEIGDSVKEILGYECVMAVCDFRGRHWTAWFTPEIPLQDGPWKLSGLPGLILEAEESTGQHRFAATAVGASDRMITDVKSDDKYEPTDRKSMLKALRKFDENPVAGMSAALGVRISVKEGVETDKTLDYLETDYR